MGKGTFAKNFDVEGFPKKATWGTKKKRGEKHQNNFRDTGCDVGRWTDMSTDNLLRQTAAIWSGSSVGSCTECLIAELFTETCLVAP
jgi:hypothetical protein